MGAFGRRHGDAAPADDLAVTAAAPASPNKTNLSQVQLPPRSVQATMPAAGVACVSMETEVDMPADLMFTLLADPKEHERIFDAIEGARFKLLQEKGPWRRYELDYLARWKFWKVSGVCENKLFMETDADKGTVNFKLREPGFLKVYEGTWCIVPAGAQQLNMHSGQHNTAAPQQQPAAGLALSATRSSSSGQQQLQSCSAQAAASQQQQPWTWSSLFTYKSPHHALSSMLASITTPYLFRASAPSVADASAGPASSASSFSSGAASPFGGSSSGRSSLDGGAASTAMTTVPARSIVRIDRMMVGPKVAPPRPLGALLKNHAITQAEDMLKGLLAAAKQLQVERASTTTSSRASSGPMSIAGSHRTSDSGMSSLTDDSSSAWGRSTTSSSLSGGSSTNGDEVVLGDDNTSTTSSKRRRLRIAFPGWLPVLGKGNRGLRHVKSHRISLDDDHLVLTDV